MDSKEFYQALKKDFGHTPTAKQDITLELLSKFVLETTNNRLFLLKGYAGTGKTTISSLIKIILTKYFKLKVFRISIDDFYKTRKERTNLSKFATAVAKSP